MLIERAESAWQSVGDLYVREILSDSGLWMYMLLIQYVMIIYHMYGVYGSSILSGHSQLFRLNKSANKQILSRRSWLMQPPTNHLGSTRGLKKGKGGDTPWQLRQQDYTVHQE